MSRFPLSVQSLLDICFVQGTNHANALRRVFEARRSIPVRSLLMAACNVWFLCFSFGLDWCTDLHIWLQLQGNQEPALPTKPLLQQQEALGSIGPNKLQGGMQGGFVQGGSGPVGGTTWQSLFSSSFLSVCVCGLVAIVCFCVKHFAEGSCKERVLLT